MNISPLFRRPLALSAVAGVLGFCFIAVQNASAFDPAAGFRNMPGFRCFSQNSRGECFDFIYGGSGTRGSSNNNTGDGDISIEIGTPNSQDLVRRGSIAEFRIILTNETSRRITTDVRATLDTGLSFDSGTNTPRRITTREVEWRDVRVEEDDDKELLLRVRVSKNVSVGDELTLTVETDDGDSQEVTVEVTNSSITSITCGSSYYYVDGRRVIGRSLRSGRSCSDLEDDDNETGDYTIRISDTPDPFEPGQLITYTIDIENDDETSRRINVHAFWDNDLDYVSSSIIPDTIRSDEVEWEDVSIGRNSEKTLTLSLRSDRGMDDGDLIHLRVEAGDGSEEEDTEAFFP